MIKCNEEWTQAKRNRARQWVINGAVTPDVRCKYGWVEHKRLKVLRMARNG